MSQKDKEAIDGFLQLKADFMKNKAAFYYQSISAQQAKSTVDYPARGPAWASRTTLPAPTNNNLLDIVIQTVRELGDGSERLDIPAVESVRVQWSGYRSGASHGEPEPRISEAEKYRQLAKDARKRTAILYCHGGFYYMGSPAGSRNITVELARLTGGRCLVVDHRLCPQYPFPAALIDALVAYLSLLYPHPDCFHEASRPQDVVFVGDSAGANLSFSLLLLIQNIRNRYGGRVQFHDKDVEVPFPAGFASVGCQMDLTVSFPFNEENKKFDILLPTPPSLSDDMSSCPIWPSSPPRGEMYCDTSLLCHPLVSPVAAKSFSSLPPMFFAYGEEYLGHEGRLVAQRATKEDVIVEYHHYRRLLHVFPLMYPKLPQSEHCLREMARFCSSCVHDPQRLQAQCVTYTTDWRQIQAVESSLSSPETMDLNSATVLERMQKARSRRRAWTGPARMSQL